MTQATPRNRIQKGQRGATPETAANIEIAQIERRMRNQEASMFRTEPDPEPEPMHDRDVPAYLRRRMACCDDTLNFTDHGQAQRYKAYTQRLMRALDSYAADREAA